MWKYSSGNLQASECSSLKVILETYRLELVAWPHTITGRVESTNISDAQKLEELGTYTKDLSFLEFKQHPILFSYALLFSRSHLQINSFISLRIVTSLIHVQRCNSTCLVASWVSTISSHFNPFPMQCSPKCKDFTSKYVTLCKLRGRDEFTSKLVECCDTPFWT